MTIQQICTFFLSIGTEGLAKTGYRGAAPLSFRSNELSNGYNARFGIEVEDVQEIIRQQPLTPVPLAGPDICGLMNLRGQVIPVIDLPCRLGLRLVSCSISEQPIYNVIVQSTEDVVSFVVDGIGDIMDFSPETLEPPPATLEPHLRASLRGAYKLENEFLLVLNTQKILDPALSRRYD